MLGPIRAQARLLALLATLAAPAALAQEASADPRAQAFTQQLARLINAYRALNGLEPLATEEQLEALAGEHSAQMTAARRLSHEGFRERAQLTRSKVCVENVGWNYRTPESLLEGWRQSPTHHRNLLEPRVSRMGVAIRSVYVTFFACR